MRKYSLRTFWLILFFGIFISAATYSAVVYTLEHTRIAEHEKNDIINDIKSFNSDLSILANKNNLDKIAHYLDSHSQINMMIKSLSLVRSGKVDFSSNPHYIGRKYRSFNCIGVNKFQHADTLTIDSVVCKTLSTDSITKSNPVLLLVEINTENFNSYINSTLSYHLSAIVIMSIISLSMLVLLLNKLIINPIKTINDKLQKRDFSYSNFSLIDLDNIDKNILDNTKSINSKNILLDSIINVTDDLIFFKDKNFKYFGCNNAFLKFVGKTKDEMIGHEDFELFPQEMAKLFREMDIKMLKEKKIRSNFEWVTYPDGTKLYLLTQKIPFPYDDDKDIGILGISRDLTELHLAQKEIEAQAYMDELTKINNRKAYNQKLGELLSTYNRYKRPFTILMYDIDDFKKINDEFGHNIGDKVLVDMSQLIASCIRENDHLFRIGGEEFIVLFSETSLERAKVVAEKIRESVENRLDTINNRKITISIGLTEVKEGDTEDSIFKRADDLLYKSKKAGKNKVSY